MQYLGKILAISHTELTGVMSVQNVKNLRHRGTLQQLRRACPGTEALFAVDSLPEKYRQTVLTMYPTPEQEVSSRFKIVPDGGALLFFNGYTLSDGRHLPQGKIDELCANAAILNGFKKMLEQSDSLNARLGKKTINRGDFWKRAAQHLATITEQNSLPGNARMLQRKYNDYISNGYESLISQRWGNQNGLKVKDEQQNLLTLLLSHYNNLDNAQIAEYYNDEAAKHEDWKPITPSAVAVWRQKTDLTTSAARRGTSNFYNEKAMQVKRSRPSAPFLMWSLDGWDCELLYQTTKTDRNGHNVTTYTNRLVVECVIDPCCDYIIGYAIGIQEDSNLITAAIANALQHSEQLFGKMHRTNQLQSDHFALKAMSQVYEAVADKVTPARVKNAKSKPVERFFGYLNKTYCQHCSNWAGFGITSDPKKQPNSEAINLSKKDFPDYEGVVAQITAMIEADRAKKREQFKAMYDHLPDDRNLTLSREDWLYFFGQTTGRTNRLTGQGLSPKILGQQRFYDCFDIKFREFAFEDWTVKYDPDDLSTVLAVNGDGSRRFILEEKYIQPMALADRKDGDSEQLQKIRDYNQRLDEHVTNHLADAADGVAKIVRLPQTAKLLGRLMLTDSDGQHKTPKRRAALQAASPDPPPDPDYDMF